MGLIFTEKKYLPWNRVRKIMLIRKHTTVPSRKDKVIVYPTDQRCPCSVLIRQRRESVAQSGISLHRMTFIHSRDTMVEPTPQIYQQHSIIALARKAIPQPSNLHTPCDGSISAILPHRTCQYHRSATVFPGETAHAEATVVV